MRWMARGSSTNAAQSVLGGTPRAVPTVLDHYVAGGRAPNPRQSDSIRPLSLREDERRDLMAFLQSLTDEALLRDPHWSDPWTVSVP